LHSGNFSREIQFAIAPGSRGRICASGANFELVTNPQKMDDVNIKKSGLGGSPMLLKGWFSAIRQHCSRRFRQSGDEEGVEIRRLLQELLDLEKPTEKVPTEVPVDLSHSRLHR